MQTQKLIERLSALLPALKAEGNLDLAVRVEGAIADLRRSAVSDGRAPQAPGKSA